MSKFIIVKEALTNKVVRYIFSRYFTYLIQFLNTIFIAIYLGPSSLGIWGFINLVLQYAGQLNLGIPHSINNLMSINKNRLDYVSLLFNTCLILVLALAALVLLFFCCILFFNFELGEKYNFLEYAPHVCIIAILNHFISIFSNLFRVFNRLSEISLSQSVFPVLMSVAIILSNGENLIYFLLYANIIAFCVSLFIFCWKSPTKIHLRFDTNIAKQIFRKSLYLFIYNTSFYLILISTRSFVSSFYTLKEFGFFTFSFTLANVLFLLLNSFSFLIFPKTINRLSSAGLEETLEIIRKVRANYIVLSHGLVHVAVMCSPLLIYYFPNYHPAENGFRIIVLTLILYTNCYGYSTLLMSRGKDKKLSILSSCALVVNVIIAYLLVRFKVRFDFIMLSSAISYFIYSIFINLHGRKIIKASIKPAALLQSAFPVGLFIPYLTSLGFVLSDLSALFYIVPLGLYLLLNRTEIYELISTFKKILSSPELVDV